MRIKTYKLLNSIYQNYYYFIIYIFFFILFSSILFFKIDTDIQTHIRLAYNVVHLNEPISPNFLFYSLLIGLSFFSKNIIIYCLNAAILLALSMTYKLYLSKIYLQKIAQTDNKKIIWLFSISLIFVFSLPSIEFFKDKVFYIGYLTPTIWHNSTIIFLMPFAILLFFNSFSLIESSVVLSKKHFLSLAFFIFLNAAIKPSFLFCWLPSIIIIIISNFRTRKNFYLILYISLFTLLLIGSQYFYIYVMKNTSHHLYSNDNSRIIIAPFKVWKTYSDHIFTAILSSLFFPIIYLCFRGKNLLKNKLYVFSLIQLFFSLIIWIFLAEDGPRFTHANFFWQIVPSTFILFFLSISDYIKNILNKTRLTFKEKLVFAAYIVHVFYGLCYVARIFILKAYY